MITQNRLRILAMKNDFSLTGKKYKEAIKYYGYTENDLLNSNMLIYPMPVLKNSRTLSKQASLPRLPVPSLDSSINKYLTAVKPLMNSQEFENTKKAAQEFLAKDGLGERLQKMLVEKSKSTDCWLSQWWLDKIYLEPRYNVVINVNPSSLYPKANYTTLDEQLVFATRYIFGFLDFKNYLEEQKLPVEKSGDSFLCMDQYYKLIGTCRVPARQKDIIKIIQSYNVDYSRINHITVIHNNRIFKLEVINPKTGIVHNPNNVYMSLKRIVEISNKAEKIGLGILTTENRDTWADVYNKLNNDVKNSQNFEYINHSLFVLCLDTKESSPSDDSLIDERSWASSQLLHGNKTFSSNRWFDKTIQVIIGVNGVWGVNFEHSIAEAVPHAVMNDYIYRFILNDNTPIIKTDESTITNLYNELVFNISNDIRVQMEKSFEILAKQIDNLDLFILYFDIFGKDFPKSQRVSPDAFVQVALQLAFYKLHFRLGNAYESGSLRKYHLGRTEIIRACSEDSAEFVKSMSDNDVTNDEKARLLLKAINSHRNYTTKVMNCESFDRHLLGLKLIALEKGLELPRLYNDVSFQRLCHYLISSSQVSSKFEAVTAFGPAVEDGYGTCYNITEKKLIFGISSFKSCKETNSKLFGHYIYNSLIECQRLLIKLNSKL